MSWRVSVLACVVVMNAGVGARQSQVLLNNLLNKCQIGIGGGGLGLTMSLEGACQKPEEVQGMGVYMVRIPGGGPNEGTIMKRPAPVK